MPKRSCHAEQPWSFTSLLHRWLLTLINSRITWTEIGILLANLVLDVWIYLADYLEVDLAWVVDVIEDWTERVRRRRERLVRDQEQLQEKIAMQLF